MKKKPWLILLFSALHALIPIWYVYQLMYIYNKNVLNAGTYDLFYVTLMSVWAVAVAVGLFRMSAWGFWLFVSHATWVLASYLILYFREVNLPLSLVAFGITATLVALAMPMILRNIFSPFFNPHLRWWRTPPRFVLTSEMVLQSTCSNETCDLYDINRNGCYLKGDFANLYKSGEQITFKLLHKDEEFSVKGKVVWVNTKSIETKPAGMGVKFQDISPQAKSRIADLLNDLDKQGNRIR